MSRPLYDTRMLAVLDYLKDKKAMLYKESCEKINFSPGNLKNIRDGKYSFTAAQIELAIKHFRVNPAYFFKPKAEMFDPGEITKKDRLLEALPRLKSLADNLQGEIFNITRPK